MTAFPGATPSSPSAPSAPLPGSTGPSSPVSGFTSPATIVPRPAGSGPELLARRQDAAWWALEANVLPQGWRFNVRPPAATGNGAASFHSGRSVAATGAAALPPGARYITDENGQYVPAIRIPGSPRPGSDAWVGQATAAAGRAAVGTPQAAPAPVRPAPAAAPAPIPTPSGAIPLPGPAASAPAARVVAASTPSSNAQTAVASSATPRAAGGLPAVSSFAMPTAGGATVIDPLPSAARPKATAKAKDGPPLALVLGGGVLAVGVLIWWLTRKPGKRRGRKGVSRR